MSEIPRRIHDEVENFHVVDWVVEYEGRQAGCQNKSRSLRIKTSYSIQH